MTTQPMTDTSVREYRAKPGAGLQGALFLGGGIIFLLVLALQFVLMLGSKPRAENRMMPGILGGVSVVGIGMIARGLFVLRAPHRAEATPDVLVVEGFASRAIVRWSDVARIERARRSPLLAGESVEVMILRGDRDRALATIPATVEPFEDLCRVAESRSTQARGRQTFDAADNEGRQQTKAVRKLKWTAVGFALFTLAMGAAFVAGVNEELHERKFGTEGAVVPAKVVRRYMVRVTPWVEYAFDDAAGPRHTREVMMSQEGYDALEGAGTVDVEYVRSDPEWNRPVSGRSPEEANFGGKFLLVTGGGFVMFGLLFVTTAMGFDLRVEDGRTKLMRRGRVLREWGPK